MDTSALTSAWLERAEHGCAGRIPEAQGEGYGPAAAYANS